MAVAAVGLTAHRIDHTGLVGAAIALALVGALGMLAFRDHNVGLPFYLLYPVSGIVGYDLAARRGMREGVVLRAAGYVAGYAVAVGVMAAGFAVCNALGALGDSPGWSVAWAVSVAGAPPGRSGVRALARGLDARPWALLAGSVALTLLAWSA